MTGAVLSAIAVLAAATAEPPPIEPKATHRDAQTAEAVHGAVGGDDGRSVPEEIFHHVADAKTWEAENPLYGTFGGPKTLLVVDFHRDPYRRHADDGPVIDLDLDWQVSVLGHRVDLTPTKHALMMWWVALLLVAVLLRAARGRALVPKGLYAIVETVVQYLSEEVAQKNIPGKDAARRFTPYLCTVFCFILLMNLWGLVPFMATATSNLAITAGLAVCTFVLTQAAGIRSAGLGGYLKHLTGGVHPVLWPILVPVEVLGLFTKPFALTVRLFANMVAGHIVIFFLIGLIFMMSKWMFIVSVPFALGVFLLELLVAVIQAFVFTMLSSVFIGMGVAIGHHGVAEHAEAG